MSASELASGQVPEEQPSRSTSPEVPNAGLMSAIRQAFISASQFISCPKCGSRGNMSPQLDSGRYILRCLALVLGKPCRAKLTEPKAFAAALAGPLAADAKRRLTRLQARRRSVAIRHRLPPAPPSAAARMEVEDDVCAPLVHNDDTPAPEPSVAQLMSTMMAFMKNTTAQLVQLSGRLDVLAAHREPLPSYAQVAASPCVGAAHVPVATPTAEQPARPRSQLPDQALSRIPAASGRTSRSHALANSGMAATSGRTSRSHAPADSGMTATRRALSPEAAKLLAATLRAGPISAERRFARVYVYEVIPRGLGDLRRTLTLLGIHARPMELAFLGRSKILEITVHTGAVARMIQALGSMGFATKTGLNPEDPSLLTGHRWATASHAERAAEARRVYIARLQRMIPRQVRPSVAGFLKRELHRVGGVLPNHDQQRQTVSAGPDDWVTVERRRTRRRRRKATGTTRPAASPSPTPIGADSVVAETWCSDDDQALPDVAEATTAGPPPAGSATTIATASDPLVGPPTVSSAPHGKTATAVRSSSACTTREFTPRHRSRRSIIASRAADAFTAKKRRLSMILAPSNPTTGSEPDPSPRC